MPNSATRFQPEKSLENLLLLLGHDSICDTTHTQANANAEHICAAALSAKFAVSAADMPFG